MLLTAIGEELQGREREIERVSTVLIITKIKLIVINIFFIINTLITIVILMEIFDSIAYLIVLITIITYPSSPYSLWEPGEERGRFKACPCVAPTALSAGLVQEKHQGRKYEDYDKTLDGNNVKDWDDTSDMVDDNSNVMIREVWHGREFVLGRRCRTKRISSSPKGKNDFD